VTEGIRGSFKRGLPDQTWRGDGPNIENRDEIGGEAFNRSLVTCSATQAQQPIHEQNAEQTAARQKPSHDGHP